MEQLTSLLLERHPSQEARPGAGADMSQARAIDTRATFHMTSPTVRDSGVVSHKKSDADQWKRGSPRYTQDLREDTSTHASHDVRALTAIYNTVDLVNLDGIASMNSVQNSYSHNQVQ
jgi:hypothetical protein